MADAYLKEPPIELLRKFVRLDASTGKLYWTVTRNSRAIAGGEAFCTLSSGGYRQGRFNYWRPLAHRVVFALFHGRWPVGDLDHKDGNRSNNSPANLREANDSQNSHNKKKSRCVATSRYKGVCWNSKSGKWQAAAKLQGKSHYLGLYDSENDAAVAYDSFAVRHFGDFARVNFAAPSGGVLPSE